MCVYISLFSWFAIFFIFNPVVPTPTLKSAHQNNPVRKLLINTKKCSVVLFIMSSLSQSPSEIFMVRPGNFMFNMETAVTNHYQNKMETASDPNMKLALAEFDKAVDVLKANNINLTVFQDTEEPIKPGPLILELSEIFKFKFFIQRSQTTTKSLQRILPQPII